MNVYNPVPSIQQNELGTGTGDMPQWALLRKMEATDPNLVTSAERYEPDEDYYKDFGRSEIVDRTLDTPWLESQQPMVRGAAARENLQARYQGGRYDTQNRPRQPDMFYGFVGNDPRGVVNEPRMDQRRVFMEGKMVELLPRMGKNDDGALAERPWTNQSISYSKKDMFKRVRGLTKIFTPSKENFVRGIGRGPKSTFETPTRKLLMTQDEATGAEANTAGDRTPAMLYSYNTKYRRDAWLHGVHDASTSYDEYANTPQTTKLPPKELKAMQKYIANDMMHNDDSMLQRSAIGKNSAMTLLVAGKVSQLRKQGMNDEEIKQMLTSQLKEDTMLRKLSVQKYDPSVVMRQGKVDPELLQSPLAMAQAIMYGAMKQPQSTQSIANLVEEGQTRDGLELQSALQHMGAPHGDNINVKMQTLVDIHPDGDMLQIKQYRGVGAPTLAKHISRVTITDVGDADSSYMNVGKNKAQQLATHQMRTTSTQQQMAESILTKMGKQRGAPVDQYSQVHAVTQHDHGKDTQQWAFGGGSAGMMSGKNKIRADRTNEDARENNELAVNDL